jgi:hypothetical protein
MPRPPIFASALWYAQHGLHVLALKPHSKEPHPHLCPNGVYSATTDPTIITGWFNTEPEINIGIAGGLACGGLAIFDFDNDPAGGRDGMAWFKQQYEAGTFPEDVAVVKTPRNGRHVYMRIPTGLDVPNSVDKLAPGVEVRAAGYYVVAPPSVYQGKPYEWLISPRQVGFPDVPPELLELAQEAGKGAEPPRREGAATTIPPNINLTDAEKVGKRLVNDALARVAREGGRHNACVWLSCQLRDSRFDLFTAEHWVEEYWRAVQHQGSHEYPWSDATKTLNSCYADPPRDPHPAAVYNQKQAAKAAATKPKPPTVQDEIDAELLADLAAFDAPEETPAQAPPPAAGEIKLSSLNREELLQIIADNDSIVIRLTEQITGYEDQLSEARGTLATVQDEHAHCQEEIARLKRELATAREDAKRSETAFRTESDAHKATKAELERRNSHFDWAYGLLGMQNVNPGVLRTLFFLRWQVEGEQRDNGLDPAAPVRVNISSLALDSGQSPAVVGRHIKQAEALGLIGSRQVNRTLAADGTPSTKVSVTVPPEFFDDPRKLEPTEKRNWGGARVKCPNPKCQSQQIKATAYICMDCGTEWKSDFLEKMEEDAEAIREETRQRRGKSKPVLSMAASLAPAPTVQDEIPERELDDYDFILSDPTVQDEIEAEAISQDVQPLDESISLQDVQWEDPELAAMETALLGVEQEIHYDDMGYAYIEVGELWPAETDTEGSYTPAATLREYIPKSDPSTISEDME